MNNDQKYILSALVEIAEENLVKFVDFYVNRCVDGQQKEQEEVGKLLDELRDISYQYEYEGKL